MHKRHLDFLPDVSFVIVNPFDDPEAVFRRVFRYCVVVGYAREISCRSAPSPWGSLGPFRSCIECFTYPISRFRVRWFLGLEMVEIEFCAMVVHFVSSKKDSEEVDF